MDANHLKTFLEIVTVGSFIRAADRLNVTQTAVTARIRSLEEHVGAKLFIRNRSGATLTEKGELFLPHALKVLNAWEDAQQSVSVPEGRHSRIVLGCESSLWNPLLIDWMAWLHREIPDVAVTSIIADADAIVKSLKEDRLDAALVHQPNYFIGVNVEQILEEKLIHVANPLKPSPDLHIHWGQGFDDENRLVVSSRSSSPYSFNLGPAALQFMLNYGGNGWFRTRVVQPHLDNGTLIRVPDKPEFTYPVYVTYPKPKVNNVLGSVLHGLRSIAQIDPPWKL